MKEIIEEMQQELINWSIKENLCFTFDATWKHAEVLYNAGYRKIPEGSVIVSKQIWEEHIEKREKANKIFEEQVRKKTAREFATTLISVLWEEEKDEKIRIKDVHGVIRDILDSEYGVDLRVVEE